MDNLGEMDKFLERYNLPRLNQEEEDFHRTKKNKEIEFFNEWMNKEDVTIYIHSFDDRQ